MLDLELLRKYGLKYNLDMLYTGIKLNFLMASIISKYAIELLEKNVYN